ncbi:MAG: LppX_LprAFG lipoprotein [Chloroflexi bacterium]|nr:LppX_LprAFG lipoprotein [Chloroflexota bacterium]
MRRLLLLALLAALLACRGAGAPTPATLTPEDILKRAGQAMGRLESFHFQMRHEGGTTPLMPGLDLIAVDGDVVHPGRMKATLGVKASGYAGEMFLSIDIVTIGDTTWMGGLFPGRWTAQPASVSPAGFFDPDAGMKAILEALTELALLPETKADGASAYRLSGKVDAEALRPVVGHPVPGAVPVEVWISQADYRVLRLRLQGRLVEGDSEDISRIIDLSRFDEPVAIEPPQ